MRPPDLHGMADAWLIPNNRKHPNWQPDWEAGLVQYLLHCSWAHLMWSWYAVSGIHLRPIPGVRPAYKQFPEAEYEIQVLALHPRMKPDPDLLEKGLQQLDFLTPADLVHQISGIDDQQFKSLVQDVVLTIVEGRASPDQDWQSWWKASIDATVEHIKEGKHKLQ